MKIYHYTKLTKLNGIFSAGVIATEMKATLNPLPSFTDYVWLTEKPSYPKTALPLFSMFPETSIALHLKHKNISVDLDKIGAVLGKFYRFSFDSTDSRFKKWFHSDERKSISHTQSWMEMESIANKVGDEVRGFWISTENLDLEDFSLEVFDGGVWKPVLNSASISNMSTEETQIIKMLKKESINKCEEFNLPATTFKNEEAANEQHLKLAA